MDFGVLGLEGIVGPDNGAPFQTQLPPPPLLSAEAKPKLLGSGFTKQERSSDSAEDHCKSSKLPRTDDLPTPKTMPLHQGTPLLRSNSLVSADTSHQEHMLSFSSLKSEVPFISKDVGFVERSTQNSGFSYYQHTPSTYTRNAGNFFVFWFVTLLFLGKKKLVLCGWLWFLIFVRLGFGKCAFRYKRFRHTLCAENRVAEIIK